MTPESTRIQHVRWCYTNTISNFISKNEHDWLECMKENFMRNIDLPLGESQVRAWKDCFRVLQDELPGIATEYPAFHIFFKYCLPYESGRRLDALFINQEHVIVLEFKQSFQQNIITAETSRSV